MELRESGNGIDSWNEVTLVYNAALKQVETKMEILNYEFQHVHQYNPIEHIKSRIKTPESIVKKLRRHGLESTIENMVEYVNDIAGIRIICSFTSDIYRIADMITRQKDIRVLAVKDYITYPKPSGYKSYHMIISIPVYLSDRIVDAKVEIQIRTVAMDFWASLEHKIHYKFEGDGPEHIRRELVECAKLVSDLDARMLSLNEEIQMLGSKQEEQAPAEEAHIPTEEQVPREEQEPTEEQVPREEQAPMEEQVPTEGQVPREEQEPTGGAGSNG